MGEDVALDFADGGTVEPEARQDVEEKRVLAPVELTVAPGHGVQQAVGRGELPGGDVLPEKAGVDLDVATKLDRNAGVSGGRVGDTLGASQEVVEHGPLTGIDDAVGGGQADHGVEQQVAVGGGAGLDDQGVHVGGVRLQRPALGDLDGDGLQQEHAVELVRVAHLDVEGPRHEEAMGVLGEEVRQGVPHDAGPQGDGGDAHEGGVVEGAVFDGREVDAVAVEGAGSMIEEGAGEHRADGDAATPARLDMGRDAQARAGPGRMGGDLEGGATDGEGCSQRAHDGAREHEEERRENRDEDEGENEKGQGEPGAASPGRRPLGKGCVDAGWTEKARWCGTPEVRDARRRRGSNMKVTKSVGFGCVVLLAALPMMTACDKLTGNSGGETQAVAPVEATPTSTDVVRYAGMETAVSGTFSVRQTATVRRAADASSDVVDTLAPGTAVLLQAQYAGNTFSLVQWTGSGGTRQGWLETSKLVASSRTIVLDAGTRDSGLGFQGLGPNGGTPTATPTPAPTPTPTPTPTTTAPPTATPTSTAKPPPTSTSTGAKPPPKPTSTPKGGTKPPKLGG